MAPNFSEQQSEIIKHIAALVEERKHEINIHYSELKLRLPTYLKKVTIQQLRDAGATIDPDISIPRAAADTIQKQAFINEKVEELRESFKKQVKEYYDNIKRQLPKETLTKKMSELTDGEYEMLGLDPSKFRHENQ